MKNLRAVLFAFSFLLIGCVSFQAAAQEHPVADSTIELGGFERIGGIVHGISLDVAVDVSRYTAVRIGYAFTEETVGGICAFSYMHRGTAVGMVINPSLESYGVYVNRWVSVGTIFTFSIKGAYEMGNSNSWFSLQPQVGIGNGRFRLLYGYSFPAFLERKTDVPRHTFTLAFTPFSMPVSNDR